jgi:hypothetical protein
MQTEARNKADLTEADLMCMACEMDELWMLYMEQQAAKKLAADRASPTVPSPEPNTSSNANPTPTCDEPTGE